ncbi:MAG: 50S ribosomal protein L35 [Gaiellales bacterium]
MPKMKTKSAAKKRFKVTATGKIMHKNAFSSHNMEHKTRKRKRQFRKDQALAASDYKSVKGMLGSYYTR